MVWSVGRLNFVFQEMDEQSARACEDQGYQRGIKGAWQNLLHPPQVRQAHDQAWDHEQRGGCDHDTRAASTRKEPQPKGCMFEKT